MVGNRIIKSLEDRDEATPQMRNL